MPLSPRVWTSEHFEAGTKYPTARVVDRDGNVVVAGDFTGSAVIRVYDLGSTTPTTAIYSNTVAIGTVIAALAAWDIDDEGYNFRTSISSNNVAWEGNHTYRVSALLPHTSQGNIPVVFDIAIRELMSL